VGGVYGPNKDAVITTKSERENCHRKPCTPGYIGKGGK